MPKFKKDQLVVLLGAGASRDAGIPTSRQMISQIENLIKDEWQSYEDLYNFIKSSIFYADGIKGNFTSKENFDIERLVNTLEQLSEQAEHPLFPFIGTWNMKLKELAGQNLNEVNQFQDMILERLHNEWVPVENYDEAAYLKELVDLKSEYDYPLRIFTLNYDLCIEKVCNNSRWDVTRGFTESPDRRWDWQLMDNLTSETLPDIFLYKLHGSIDWYYDQGKLRYTDTIANQDPKNTAIIFGTDYKLQYSDPFLFFAYQFRKWTMGEAKLILSIGYGFRDEHINKILGQALNSSQEKKLLSITPINCEGSREAKEEEEQRIASALNVDNSEQIITGDYTAKGYLQNILNLDELEELLPKGENQFEQL